jgi:hypothetical protein
MNHGFRVRKREDQNYIVAYFAYINLKRKRIRNGYHTIFQNLMCFQIVSSFIVSNIYCFQLLLSIKMLILKLDLYLM